MTATATEKDYKDLQGKRVLVTRNLAEANEKGETAVEIEGVVEAWNPDMGLLVKPKGRVQLELIPTGEIEDVNEVDDSNVKLKAAKLQILKPGQARRHLLDRHGLTLDQVNALTEDQAAEQHAKIDHEAAGLGHVHVEKKDKDESESDDAGDSSSDES